MAADKPGLKRRNFIIVALLSFLVMEFSDIIGVILSLVILDGIEMSDGMTFVTYYYLPCIGLFVIMPLFMYFWDRDVFRDILPANREGALPGNTVRMLGLGLLAGFATNGFCILLAWLHKDIHFDIGNVEWLTMIYAFICTFIQSGSEEILTRQYMLGSLRRRYPEWFAIIFNAAIFMLLHIFNDGISALALVSLFVCGMSYSIVVCYTGSLWMAVGIHTMWNFTQQFIFGLPNSGLVSGASILKLDAATARDSLFYSVDFGVEETVISIAADAALGIIVYLWARRRRTTDGSAD